MMFRKILGYGIAAGLITGLPLSFIIVGAGDKVPHGMVVGYLTMLVALSLVFVAIKRHRDIELGGVIRFWPALGIGLGISVVAGICYVLAWESVVSIAHFDFASIYARSLIEQKRASGASAAEIAAFTAEMDRFRVQYANPLFRLPMTFAEIFPVGVLVSLVSAALLRRPQFMPARRSGPVRGEPQAAKSSELGA